MCSIDSIDRDGKLCSLMTIPQFWSSRKHWSTGCCVAANIKLGEYSCQLQVFPAGNGERINSDGTSGMVIVLTNTSASDLIIDGKFSLEFHKGGSGPLFNTSHRLVKLSKFGNLRLFEVTPKVLDPIESSCVRDDLNIVFELTAKSVESEEYGGTKSEIKKGASKMDYLGDQIIGGLESIQDILLETPFCKEWEHEHRLKDSLPESILTLAAGLKEVSVALKEDMSVVEETHELAKKQGTHLTASIGQAKEEILHAVGSIHTSLKAETKRSHEVKTLDAISEVKGQLEMLQDSVLTAVSSPPPVFRPVYPECPICEEEFSPTAQIFQCVSGHLICTTCRNKPGISDCPYCHQKIMGRNRGLETFLLKLKDG